MNNLLLKRISAFLIDYLLIVIYALLLFGTTHLIGVKELSPSEGQAVGFISLTLPVFLYFYFMEKSKTAATIGKRVMNIAVYVNDIKTGKSVFLRNFLKFLPWEIAHFGVHWIVYYSAVEKEPPVWLWMALILPQLMVLMYVVSILFYKGKSSFYDQIANTIVKRRVPE